MKTFTCDICSTKKVPASEMHLGWKHCAACRAARSAKVRAEHELAAAAGLLNGARTLAAAKAAEAARSPEEKAAADAFEAARSESQAAQSVAFRAAAERLGHGYEADDAAAHCED